MNNLQLYGPIYQAKSLRIPFSPRMSRDTRVPLTLVSKLVYNQLSKDLQPT